jgi:hypothetical protein
MPSKIILAHLKIIGILHVFVPVHIDKKLNNSWLGRGRRFLKCLGKNMQVTLVSSRIHILAKFQKQFQAGDIGGIHSPESMSQMRRRAVMEKIYRSGLNGFFLRPESDLLR